LTQNLSSFSTALHQRIATPGMHKIALINGQIASIQYVGEFTSRAQLLTIHEGRIHTIYRIMNPDKLRAIPPLN